MCVDRGLETGWSPVKGVLPTGFIETEKEAKTQLKDCRHINIDKIKDVLEIN
jgi:hypothetical protein